MEEHSRILTRGEASASYLRRSTTTSLSSLISPPLTKSSYDIVQLPLKFGLVTQTAHEIIIIPRCANENGILNAMRNHIRDWLLPNLIIAKEPYILPHGIDTMTLSSCIHVMVSILEALTILKVPLIQHQAHLIMLPTLNCDRSGILIQSYDENATYTTSSCIWNLFFNHKYLSIQDIECNLKYVRSFLAHTLSMPVKFELQNNAWIKISVETYYRALQHFRQLELVKPLSIYSKEYNEYKGERELLTKDQILLPLDINEENFSIME